MYINYLLNTVVIFIWYWSVKIDTILFLKPKKKKIMKLEKEIKKMYSKYLPETQLYLQDVHSFLKSKYGEIQNQWLGQLNQLAYNYDLFLRCQDKIANDGLMIKDRFGTLVKHPLLKVMNDATIQCSKMSQFFGLNVYSDGKINFVASDDSDDLVKALISGNDE